MCWGWHNDNSNLSSVLFWQLYIQLAVILPCSITKSPKTVEIKIYCPSPPGKKINWWLSLLIVIFIWRLKELNQLGPGHGKALPLLAGASGHPPRMPYKKSIFTCCIGSSCCGSGNYKFLWIYFGAQNPDLSQSDKNIDKISICWKLFHQKINFNRRIYGLNINENLKNLIPYAGL